jgi:hypothetical protein
MCFGILTRFYCQSFASTHIANSVTTPEKWDSLTRRWVDHRQIMNLISLFLVMLQIVVYMIY